MTEDKTKEITKKEQDSTDKHLSDKIVYSMLIEEAKRTANKLMLTGIGWIVAGLIITGITYSAAEPGGTYYIFWGLCIYGAYRLIKGIYYYSMPHKLIEKTISRDKETNSKNKK